jgi:hypothetical protein
MGQHRGGCHCGAVAFTVELPSSFDVEDCNCSICAKSGNLHVIVPAAHFTLVSGAQHLTTYMFNTGVARHLFCKVCGVKSFYQPRSNPDGYAVTWRCLENWETLDANVTAFDGQNWEANAGRLAHKSKL